MDAALRIASLEELVERQAIRIRDLELALMGEFQPPVEWNLCRREIQIFGLLVQPERVTKDMLQLAFDDGGEIDLNVWESHVSKLRRKLRPFAVEIECKRYLGYRLLNRETYRRAA